MGKRRKGRGQSPSDLGSREFTCPDCGHSFSWAWTDIFDLQEATHGMVGYDAPLEFVVCPECGESVEEEPAYTPNPAGPPETKRRALPRQIRADMPRALMHAYYQYVCGCSVVDVDEPLLYGAPWVALGIGADRIWMADFSTTYELPQEMKPVTLVRRMKERIAQAAAEAASYASLASGPSTAPLPVEYEIWCFLPPSPRLMEAYDQVRAAGGQVTILFPDDVTERIRQTVLAVPPEAGEQAFAQAAVMIRTTFGLEPKRPT